MFKIIYEHLVCKKMHRASIKQLKKLKKKYEGGSALIIGNGPSLNHLNVDEAKSYDIRIACNHFYNHPYSHLLNIEFYTVSDPRLFLPMDYNWLKGVKECKPYNLVVPHKFCHTSLLYNRNILYYQYDGHRKLWEDNAPCFDLNHGLPSGDTVVSDISIPLAVYLGIKKLAFAGVDLQHQATGVSHAYDETQIKSKRRSDAYLLKEWPNNTSISLQKQFYLLSSFGIEIRMLQGSAYFNELINKSLNNNKSV